MSHLGVHVAPICVFTFDRSTCSRSAGTRTLYQDGVKKAGQEPIQAAFERIPGLQLCEAELAQLDPTDTAALQELLAASDGD